MANLYKHEGEPEKARAEYLALTLDPEMEQPREAPERLASPRTAAQ
jgi:hypothetical protein